MGSKRSFDHDDEVPGFLRDDRFRGHRPRDQRSGRDRFDDEPAPKGFAVQAPVSAPRPFSPAEATDQVTGTVAWFRAEKGFGFLTVPGKPDVFLPLSALQAAGYETVRAGATIKCEVSNDKKGKGLAVAQVVSVDETTAAAARPATAKPSRRPEPAVEETVRCVVKWFDETKGFGFLASDKGYDVFVHVSTVRRSGMDTLQPDETFLVGVAQGDRGKVAVSLDATA